MNAEPTLANRAILMAIQPRQGTLAISAGHARKQTLAASASDLNCSHDPHYPDPPILTFMDFLAFPL